MPHTAFTSQLWELVEHSSMSKKKMNEVTLLQVKTHLSTLKEFDCIIQTKNCVGGLVSLSWYSWYSGWLWPFMCYSNREGNFWRWITSKPFKLWPLNLVTSPKNYFRKSSSRIRLHWRKHGNQVLVTLFFKSCIFLKT